jgi:hypothetical protein
MARARVSASLRLQGLTSDLPVDSAQRFWLNGIAFGDNVPVSLPQDSNWLTEQDDTSPVLVRNTKRLSNTTAEIDLIQQTIYGSASIYGEDVYGGSEAVVGSAQTVTLPLDPETCQFHIVVTSDLPIAITAAKFYAYDGIVDTNPYRDISFYAAEGGVSSSWIAANGSNQALTCGTRSSGIHHEYFVACSATPTQTGEKQGKIKFLYTYSQP